MFAYFDADVGGDVKITTVIGSNGRLEAAPFFDFALIRTYSRTTTVGFPAALIALTRANCAPTNPRSERSTCSPVVAFVPGVHSRVWSSDQVPTMTTATSEFLAASTASSKPD